jgi:hypothetical protein
MVTIKRFFIVTIIIPAIVIFSNITIAQNKPAVPKPEPHVQRIAGLNAGFIVALIHDGLSGAWVGTEDDGVFLYQVDGKVSQFKRWTEKVGQESGGNKVYIRYNKYDCSQ